MLVQEQASAGEELMKSLRVLIADDDGLTLMLLRRILLSFGHEVVAAVGDGQQAVQSCS